MEGAAEALRSSLLRIDRSLVSLVAARLNIADVLGSVKRGEGMPVYDPSREIAVANLLVEEARRLGVPENLVKEIYFLLARESRCRQLYCPEALRVAFYGYGRMARTLASAMARGGCWVAITGRSVEKAREAAGAVGAKYMEPGRALDWADVLVYAVPGDAVPGLLREHLPMLRESMLVADIASVKTPLVREIAGLLGDGGPEYASLHPLFGPLDCPAGETVAIVPVRLQRWRPRLERLLAGLGLSPAYLSAEEHDKVMAVNQVLHHLVYDLYREAARLLEERLDIPTDKRKELVTHSLRSTERVAARLERLRGVVEEIRRLNPYTGEVLKALREALEGLAASTDSGLEPRG
ncbi:hypothetical protein CF15_06725 [Pyrodictium occultum]|uniref:Chorismate mutase n=1 Tax=Pyrodictium occultum TaxID=2309 RepID=A0A0V8RWJ0_PYROC|nr:prephenate dehydrogenase/arogenate dehydrogenase family protein [Pyrodictium occultum]KSW12415.1 hypothetical protein CF15_06725 [Pyrodictium occultum]